MSAHLRLASLPAERGVYCLVLRLCAPVQLTVGQLGSFAFPAGWAVYVGSAGGAGGLRGRLKHHLEPASKPHWHIDYLRHVAPIREIWYAAAPTRDEHPWAAALCSLPGAAIPAPRFGASDCRCPTHLAHFADEPDAAALSHALRIALRRWQPPPAE